MAEATFEEKVDSLLSKMEEQSDYLTDENYHSEASTLDRLRDTVERNRHKPVEDQFLELLTQVSSISPY